MLGQRKSSDGRSRPLSLWIFFGLYSLVLIYSLVKHELWGDELHSWNIARNSEDFFTLLRNIRYEGHPPLWYLCLRVLSFFGFGAESIKPLHFFISLCSAYLILFRSRLPAAVSVLILLGYYFMFEYTVLCRNYSIAILLSLILVLLRRQQINHKMYWYVFLLFLLSFTHFLACILAFSFHAVFWRDFIFVRTRPRLFFILGCLAICPAIWFIIPPSDSSLGLGFWKRIWSDHQYLVASQVCVKSFFPLPVWKELHFWNTNYLCDWLKDGAWLKTKSWMISLGLVSICSSILWPHKKALLFFVANVCLSILVAFYFPLTNARYVGFVFFGFVLALLVLFSNTEVIPWRKYLIGFILLIQIPGSFVALKADWRGNFSQFEELNSLLSPYSFSPMVTDYWSLNYLSAYSNEAFYCIGYNTNRSYIVWNREMTRVLEGKNIYNEGLRIYFTKTQSEEVLLLSNNSEDRIYSKDSLFFLHYEVKLIEKREGAIEKYSDLFLYRVTKKP